MFIYIYTITYIYCLSYLIIISKNTYPSHPPCSLTKAQLQLKLPYLPSSTEVPRSLGLAPSEENNGGLGAEAKATGRNPTNMRGFPLMCFLGEVPKEKATSTTTNMLAKTQLTQNISYLKKGWKEPYLKLKQWSCNIDPQSDLLVHLWWFYIFKRINGKKHIRNQSARKVPKTSKRNRDLSLTWHTPSSAGSKIWNLSLGEMTGSWCHGLSKFHIPKFSIWSIYLTKTGEFRE